MISRFLGVVAAVFWVAVVVTTYWAAVDTSQAVGDSAILSAPATVAVVSWVFAIFSTIGAVVADLLDR